MTDYADVPDAIARRMRTACAHLPEAVEERPRGGYRWRIRGRTLAHLVTIDDEHGLTTLVWVHAAQEEIDALVAMGDPFFPGWGGGLLTIVLRDDGTTDWGEVKELVTESYCRLAPKKLIAQLDELRRPDRPS